MGSRSSAVPRSSRRCPELSWLCFAGCFSAVQRLRSRCGMCCSLFSPAHPAVGSRGRREQRGVLAGWEGLGGRQRCAGRRDGCSRVGTEPWEHPRGPSWRGTGAPPGEPCPRRVPQPCAGTTGASDSSGGRARHGTGTAREEEPVQAWPQLVSPARLRCCLIPSCSPPFPPRLSQSPELLLPGGGTMCFPSHPHRPSEPVPGNICNPESIPDGFGSGAGAGQCPWC